jgi:Spy/CpxP family protein refolding chaperone
MKTQGRTRLKVWLVLVGVFLLGSVTGAALSGVYRARSEGGRRAERDPGKALEKMRGELNLTDEQAAQINTIINETRNEFRALRAEARPRYDAIRQKERERIRGILNAEQQQKFDQMIARKDARREKHERDER